MKLLCLLIVGGGIVFPTACADGVSRLREAKAFKKTGPSSSMSYVTSYYPSISPSTIGEANNDSLVQHGQEVNNSNGVDDEDNYESTEPTSTTSTAVDSATTQATTDVVTTISTAQSTSISTTVSDSEDVSPTLSTPSSTFATESTSLVDQEVNTSNVSSVPKEEDSTVGSSCTLLEIDSEEDVVSIEILFYYRLETATFDDEMLTNIEDSLLSGMCSVTESIRRLSNNTNHQVLEWNTLPNDVVSENYDCTPSFEGAQLCNIVEAGMTVYYDGDDDEAAIETHAYEQIVDQFSSLSVDDSRVVSVKYIGKSGPSIEAEDDRIDDVQEEEIISLSYVPSPFVITASGVLLFALMIGIYGVLMRGRKRKSSSSDNDTLPPPATHEEVESIYATKEDESQATTANPSDVDTSIPIVPRYSDNDDDDTMFTLKQFVLGEDEETRTEWERLGILPVVA